MLGKLDPEERVMELPTINEQVASIERNEMNGYYSVFNPRGEKIADCGSQKDAINLIGMRNARWEGHCYMFNPLPGDIIDVSSAKQLPTSDIVVNMDGGVGGSWKEVSDKEFDEMFPFPKLNQSDEESFISE